MKSDLFGSDYRKPKKTIASVVSVIEVPEHLFKTLERCLSFGEVAISVSEIEDGTESKIKADIAEIRAKMLKAMLDK